MFFSGNISHSWDSDKWKQSLQSRAHFDQSYDLFNELIVKIAADYRISAKQALEQITQIHRDTQVVKIPAEATEIQSTSFQTVTDMVEGLFLAIKGLQIKNGIPHEGLSFSNAMRNVSTQLKAGVLSDTERVFSVIAKYFLTGKGTIEPFEELTINPPEIDQKVCNWATALSMLVRQIQGD